MDLTTPAMCPCDMPANEQPTPSTNPLRPAASPIKRRMVPQTAKPPQDGFGKGDRSAHRHRSRLVDELLDELPVFDAARGFNSAGHIDAPRLSYPDRIGYVGWGQTSG